MTHYAMEPDDNTMTCNVTVLGAGSWGLALTLSLLRGGHKVRLWAHRRETADQLNNTHTSSKLPCITLPEELTVSSQLSESVRGASALIIATPAQSVSQIGRALAPLIDPGQILIILSKGIEKESLLRMSEALSACLTDHGPDNICILSGPSHAEEVARSAPTSVVAASRSERVAVWTQKLFSSDTFRVYRSDDVTGVEIGGSVKNIIAIASGITRALGLGDNAQGALLTRGLAEMSRLGVKLGANALTFAGLSGLGDLISTCFSRHSRNRALGEKIGSGESLSQALESLGMVAEGVDTCRAVRSLAAREDVETPITDQVFQILFEGKDPKQGVRELMGRSLKQELWV